MEGQVRICCRCQHARNGGRIMHIRIRKVHTQVAGVSLASRQHGGEGGGGYTADRVTSQLCAGGGGGVYAMYANNTY